mgnify:CR=1 FL=1
MHSGSAQEELSSVDRQRRRAIPIVDVRFQWKYTLLVTAFGVGLTGLMGAFLYRAHVSNTRLLELTDNRLLQQEVIRGDQIFLLYLAVLVVAMGGSLLLWGLIITHRISGPLYIVARYLRTLSTGRYPEMRPLRRRDELQEFFGVFEEAVTALRNRDADSLRDLEETLVRLRQRTPENEDERFEDAVGVLERYRDTLREALSLSVRR